MLSEIFFSGKQPTKTFELELQICNFYAFIQYNTNFPVFFISLSTSDRTKETNLLLSILKFPFWLLSNNVNFTFFLQACFLVVYNIERHSSCLKLSGALSKKKKNLIHFRFVDKTQLIKALKSEKLIFFIISNYKITF